MAVKRRFNWYSGLRGDIPYFRSIESAVSYDVDSVLRGLITGVNQPYLIRGFDIVIPSAATLASSLQVIVSDSALLHSSATESGTILMVPPGTANDTLDNSIGSKVIGAFQNSAINYIGLDYRRTVDTSTTDQTSAWSASQKIEYQRTAPLGQVLDYRYIITTTGFGTTLPLYIVSVDSNGNVQYITKAVSSLFRLGTGGAVPDPLYRFNYQGLINGQTGNRREWVYGGSTSTTNPVTVEPGAVSSAFNYGDWSITSLKEWMDAMMTRIVELSGSQYWYVDSSFQDGPASLFNVWWDTAGNVMTGVGNLTFNYILEASLPTDGGYQTVFIDPTIQPGDSYVVDALTGSEAALSTFSSGTLVINSLTSTSWTFGGTLYNRRLFRHNSALFQLKATWNDGVYTYAQMTRQPASLPPYATSVSSWSFLVQDITVNTSTAHGFKVGDLIDIAGLVISANPPGTTAPNGVQYVRSTPTPNQFTFTATLPVGGTTSVSSATTGKDINQTGHPYTHMFLIQSWSAVGTTVTLDVLGHNLTGTPNIYVSGLLAGGSTTTAPNGGFLATVLPSGQIQYTANVAPVGAPTVQAPATIRLVDPHTFTLTVTGASPTIYNAVDETAITQSFVDFSYPIGPYTLPPEPIASGPIVFDGAVATGIITDPMLIQSISFGSGAITITLYNPHGRTDITNNTSFTIYGDPAITAYAQTYSGVTVDYLSGGANAIVLTSGTVSNHGTYNNTGSQDIFASNPDNPYPGPIQWDSDIIVKGIIGDKFFVIPQTATADGSATANRFNNNGVTGTAFIQDGEVAYVVLERNKSVSSGTLFTCSLSLGDPVLTGLVPPVDTNSQLLDIGDFVKFDDEPESYWLRISNIIGNQIQLVTDRGIPPTQDQRPLRSGRLVYCKGTYPVVTVNPHWMVPNNADIYWLAVRRDNAGPYAKVYLKSLELAVGETRSINNQTSSNLLIYTGAMVESAINPNYTLSDPAGPYQYTQVLNVISGGVDNLTQMVSFTVGPDLGFQKGDIFIQSGNPFTVSEVLTTATVITQESTSAPYQLLPGSVTYYRRNYNINDSDNLTLALRKEDRELGKVHTSMSKTVYDESVFCQLMQLDALGSGTIKSGSYVYQGANQYQPTAMAWVLHGNINGVTEPIEGVNIPMPGGATFVGPDAILVHIVTGPFVSGQPLRQNGSLTGRTCGSATLTSPPIPANTGLVLPPNRRTQVTSGSQYVIFPSPSAYMASMNSVMTGESLLVIANDTIREAGVDYSETFGGPKGQITTLRLFPESTRIRFRVMNNFGSALTSLAGSETLQMAYNIDPSGGISTLAGIPLTLRAGNAHTPAGDTALMVTGSIQVDGDYGPGVPSGIVGGIFPLVDRGMLIGSESLKPLASWTASGNVKTHTSYTGSAWTSKTAADTTTNNSARVITGSSVAIPIDTVVRFTATAVARDSLNGGSASFRLEATFKRGASGNVILVGYPITTINGSDGDGTNYAAILAPVVLTGPDLDAVAVIVYGMNAKTIYWAITEDYQMVKSAS